MELSVEQIVEVVKSNEEVRTALQGEFVNTEALTAFLDTEEGKKVVQPKMDSFASKSIETWKNNHLEKIKQEAILSANPSDTPEQRRIKELELQFKAQEEKAIFAEQKAYALNIANQKGLPAGLIDPFVGKDAQSTLQGLNTLENEFKSAVQLAVESQMGSTGRSHLPENPNAHSQTNATEVKKFEDMSYTEQARLYQSNPREWARLQAQS
ncbi:hypothetical protein BC7_00028 [Bacillus phage BC-7]|nr:hypothetical protein BC7_00028 [Bacillus phage BC-7]